MTKVKSHGSSVLQVVRPLLQLEESPQVDDVVLQLVARLLDLVRPLLQLALFLLPHIGEDLSHLRVLVQAGLLDKPPEARAEALVERVAVEVELLTAWVLLARRHAVLNVYLDAEVAVSVDRLERDSREVVAVLEEGELLCLISVKLEQLVRLLLLVLDRE